MALIRVNKASTSANLFPVEIESGKFFNIQTPAIETLPVSKSTVTLIGILGVQNASTLVAGANGQNAKFGAVAADGTITELRAWGALPDNTSIDVSACEYVIIWMQSSATVTMSLAVS